MKRINGRAPLVDAQNVEVATTFTGHPKPGQPQGIAPTVDDIKVTGDPLPDT